MWVIKYGGNAMTDAHERARVLADVRTLRAADGRPILVHGGGPYIEAALTAAGVTSRFVRGLRVTTPEALGPVEQALTLLGKRLAAELGDALGLTGRDASLLVAERFDPDPEGIGDLGEVGRMRRVRREPLEALLAHGLTPVVGCLAVDETGAPLNVNADDVAAAIAAALAAPCVFLTNVPGVLADPSDPGSRIAQLAAADARARIADGRAPGELPRVQVGRAGTRLVP
jgi:acetylglutamate kinase